MTVVILGISSTFPRNNLTFLWGMNALHVCIQHCDNWDPMTEKTQLKTNNGINEVQTCFTSIYGCSDASVFIKGKTWGNHDHTARKTASVTAAIDRNVMKRTFWLFKQTLKVLKQKTTPKRMNKRTLLPREQCHSKFQKMIHKWSLILL